MNEQALREQLRRIDGEGPSSTFDRALRAQLRGVESADVANQDSDNHDADLYDTVVSPHEGAMVEFIDRRSAPPRSSRWPFLGAAAALILVLAIVVQSVSDEGGDLTAANSEAVGVGDAWLQTIIDSDRDGFLALHAEDVVVNDTLMGFSKDTQLLTDARIGELYADGFDALQAALAIDDDVVTADGCSFVEAASVECAFTATMIGTGAYSYTVTALMVVEDGLIRSIDFTTITDPADFRVFIEDFLENEATNEDRACLTLGFNTVGCGEHESDFIMRYAGYYEAKTG
ncbi:MAG: hypothetical protein R8J94_04530 [Acidimicrobiia bacterium]|nr:hypothetical protein [Acidimicrobiia bacterium]